MRENIYFDTRALAKWYLNEARSDDVEKYIQEHGPVNISDLTVVEMRCLLARSLRTLDALHLLIAKETQADILATADRIMMAAAKAMGLSVVRFDQRGD